MIPDWVTWDHAKDLVLLGLFVWTHSSTSRQITSNTRLTKKVGAAVDFGNDVTMAIAKKEGSLPPVPDESMRPRAITLEECSFDEILAEAARVDDERKR